MAMQVIERMSAFLEASAGHAVKTSAAAYAPDISISSKGIIEGRLTVNKNDDGSPVIDPYGDITEPNMFSASYKKLDNVRRQRGDSFLMPLLFQHNQNEVIGGVTHMEQDTKGYVYTAQMVLGIKLARDCFELCKARNIWTSYGYAPTRVSYKGKYRVLNEVDIRETSLVTFPANGLSGILSAKSTFGRQSFTSYPSTKDTGIWARLSPHASPTGGLRDVTALDRRWDAFKPPSASTRTSNARWATLAPENDEDEYTMEDLLDGVHYLMSKERG